MGSGPPPTNRTDGEPGLAIRASGLTKAYGGIRVLSDLELAIPAGSVFALLGPNGAGKTTTVRILATLLRPDRGHARVAGFDLLRERAEVRRRISLTGQYVAVDEAQTGRENLVMAARLAGHSRRRATARADELLAAFDLDKDGHRRVATYSGGLRRRLDLAAGLVGRPEVIFLDEPTTGLDPRSRQETWRLVTELAASGTTVFLTTQYLDEADRLADRIALLDGGRLVAEGSADQLKRQVQEHLLQLRAADTPGYRHLLDVLRDEAVSQDATMLSIEVPTDGSAGHVRHLLDRVDPGRTMVAAFAVRAATLDDVFLALTGRPTPASAPMDREGSHV